MTDPATPLAPLDDDDEGGRIIAVTADTTGRVVLDLDRPALWVGLSMEEASRLANQIHERLRALRDLGAT